MIPAEILKIVYYIEVGAKCGTSFLLKQNEKIFLITAKHLFEELNYPKDLSIKLQINRSLTELIVSAKYSCDSEGDIAVLEPITPIELNLTKDITYSIAGTNFGQDVFFLGFPYHTEQSLISLADGENPIPIIKRACFSGMLSPSQILLDGINIKGFSGGPICAFNYSTHKWQIIGVINSYHKDIQEVYNERKIPQKLFVDGNSGIIHATSIQVALQLIEEK